MEKLTNIIDIVEDEKGNYFALCNLGKCWIQYGSLIHDTGKYRNSDFIVCNRNGEAYLCYTGALRSTGLMSKYERD